MLAEEKGLEIIPLNSKYKPCFLEYEEYLDQDLLLIINLTRGAYTPLPSRRLL